MTRLNARISSTSSIDASVHLLGSVDVLDGVVIEHGALVGARTSPGVPGSITTLGEDSFIGAGSIIGEGVSIGAGCHLHPGTVLFADAPPRSVIAGNPGQVIGYVDQQLGPIEVVEIASLVNGGRHGLPDGVDIFRFPRVVDLRGALTICEFAELPFDVKRTFFVSDVLPGLFRGAHAHRSCLQMLHCVQGALACVLDDGRSRIAVHLNMPDIGLIIPPMVWGMQYQFAPGSVLAVYASERYDKSDYIENYADFVKIRGWE